MQDYLVWEAPQGPLSILMRRTVLERLKMFAAESFTGNRTETGGVLLGHSENLIESGRYVITIENFENGMSPLPDDVVGFARFRRQAALHLSEPDFLSLRAGLGMISLIIRPDGRGGAIGGFFYRDGKTVQCPPAAMQFPIDREARDCRRLAGNAPRHEIVPEKPANRAKRLLYAAVGFMLMVSSVAIWLIGR